MDESSGTPSQEQPDQLPTLVKPDGSKRKREKVQQRLTFTRKDLISGKFWHILVSHQNVYTYTYRMRYYPKIIARPKL